MNSNIFFLLFIWLSAGVDGYKPCGIPAGCYCSSPVLTQIQCVENITVFPLFEDSIKQEVRSIVFHRSKIVGLPLFNKEEWVRLENLNFIETDLMSCDAIAEHQRPGIRILSECISMEQDCPSCNKSVSTCLIFVLLLAMLFIGAVGYIVYLLQTRTGTLPIHHPEQV